MFIWVIVWMNFSNNSSLSPCLPDGFAVVCLALFCDTNRTVLLPAYAITRQQHTQLCPGSAHGRVSEKTQYEINLRSAPTREPGIVGGFSNQKGEVSIMRNMLTSLTAVLLLTIAATCSAESTDDLARENADLRKRVEKLEKQLDELKKIVMQQQKTPARQVAEPQSRERTKPELVTPKLTKEDYRIIAEQLQKKITREKSWLDEMHVKPYGYIKLDAAYDSARIDAGNYPRWVQSEQDNDNDNQFNMTANQSRIGAIITGPENNDSLKTSGRFEMDFYGGGAENKAHFRMRHAYLTLDWPEERFSILAGQTWDVISPLYPSTLNFTIGWWTGNIGYRRPQIRLTKSYALNRNLDLKLEGAVARTIGFDDDDFYTPGDAGEDAGAPSLQARASLTFPLANKKPTTIGVSGHWAKEELDIDEFGHNKKLDSWSLNLDLTQPLNDWLTIKAECFKGENLSAYLGGIGQGVNVDKAAGIYKEVSSQGGWIAAGLGPWGKWSFNVGSCVDDPENNDLAAAGRTLNRSVFGNAIYSLNKNTTVGFELSHWRTEYDGHGDADSIRAQTSLIYKF